MRKHKLEMLAFRIQMAEELLSDDPDGSDADGDVPRNASRVQRMAAAVPIPRARYNGARHLPRAVDIDHHMRCRMAECRGKSRIECIACKVFCV